jgi:predicted ribosome quality control (RQC) complex YloA/Tae2 family protein
MPIDGIVAKCVVDELNNMLAGGRIEKIYQPESDEINLLVRAATRNYRLLMSASANYPRIHITEAEKDNPKAPPMFCMLLRKHLVGGKIANFEFHDYERIITLNIDSVTELGDLAKKKLIIEIMGRHSNIILVNNEGKIIDAIKHVDNEISSVREVMPARQYVLPPAQDKTSIDTLDLKEFEGEIKNIRSTANGTNTALGNTSVALGKSSAALGNSSAALSNSSAVLSNSSAALGNSSAALSNSSAALGNSSAALGNSSAVLSNSSAALDNSSAVLSNSSAALGNSSAALSNSSTASDNINTSLKNTNIALESNTALDKFLLNKMKGFSLLLCREVCYRAGISSSSKISSLTDDEITRLCNELETLAGILANSKFNPCILLKPEAKTFVNNSYSSQYNLPSNTVPIDFHCFEITHVGVPYFMKTINLAIDAFYTEKDRFDRLKQKKTVLIKAVSIHLDRCKKKKSILEDKLIEVADRENLKLYGELITANIYCMSANLESVRLLNYYSESSEYVDIPLDPNLTPQQNAQLYFKRYTKAKNAHAYALKQLSETENEIAYLESVLHNIESCSTTTEIDEIKIELSECGYMPSNSKHEAKQNSKQAAKQISKHATKQNSMQAAKQNSKQATKMKDAPSAPINYIIQEGNLSYSIFVGRNNLQNDLLTLKWAQSNDIWLHTKNIPGSHVIIKKPGPESIPENVMVKAAKIAAYHSKARFSSNVPVDYTQVRNVKKPGGAKPGMVIYDNYKTMYVTPDEEIAKLLSEKI